MLRERKAQNWKVKKWFSWGLIFLGAGLFLGVAIPLWMSGAVAVAQNYGERADYLYVLLSLTLAIWLTWWVAAGWGREAH